MIEDALYSIPAHDRDVWVRMAMAIKRELGDAGFAIWDQWSKQDQSYKPADAKAVWRSITPYGRITISTLYAEAKRNGWRGNNDASIKINYEAIRQRENAQIEANALRYRKAAQQAQSMIERAEIKPHEYLQKKGFPEQTGLVLGIQLLIPMRDLKSNEIVGLQRIEPWGAKKFLSGTKAKGAVFNLGQGNETYLCEGFATALSIAAALKAIYRQERVVVTFSAANLAHVASLLKGRRYVIADHDKSGTGERYATKTALPFWMPPDVGMDANDFHQSTGIRALANELNKLRGCGRP